MNKKESIIKKLLYTFRLISSLVVIVFSTIILTQFYVASDLPKGIFVIFWVMGCILILIKILSINWTMLVLNHIGEGGER